MSAELLAEVSDQLVLASVLLYLAAMIGFALELAYGKARADAPAKRAVLAGVGGPEVPEAAPTWTGAPSDEAPIVHEAPAWALRAGGIGVLLGWVGWAATLSAIIARGLSVDRWPWGNMYEFVVALCFAAVTAFLGTNLRANVRFMGAFVMVTAALGLGFAVLYLYTAAGPVVPALNSYWIAIHVSAAVLASGLFTVAGVSGILYLVRGEGMSRLPARADLERVAHKAIVLAFPVWTFAVIAGALWADKAWGRYWGWDPKEVWAFITWVAYAAYLHARVTAGWRGRAATIVQLVAYACLLFNLVGVNIFLGGLHSYADV
ncbi:c-type cytochrome biogenesis protein CcsB [Nonomuraea sp. NBC_01738]|uniref:c-type cytochrome biogenesis protein CcsB n=1 Tax=Nonomuraea sp. NBC_01738 TaxID=2976003 RepID=UPI002E14876E|nr:c-type cytochrome biogenesis protein CcsB [Nonomuraea sp. NBC_01738]